MKLTGRIFEIKHFSVHDGPGIRTTVFLKGCPLSCVWCHNPEGMNTRPELAYIEKKCSGCGACTKVCPTHSQQIIDDGQRIFDRKNCILCGKCARVCYPEALLLYGKEVTVDDAIDDILPDLDFYRNSGGGVTISGGEPLLQVDFTAELLKRCKEYGIRTAVDTSGFAPFRVLNKVIQDTDLFLYDLKLMNSELHVKYTGVPNELILDNLKELGIHNKAVEIRIPVIPGINDNYDNMTQAAQLLSTIPSVRTIRLLRYHSMARSKYTAIGRTDTMPDVDSPVEERMEEIAGWFKSFGLPVIY